MGEGWRSSRGDGRRASKREDKEEEENVRRYKKKEEKEKTRRTWGKELGKRIRGMCKYGGCE